MKPLKSNKHNSVNNLEKIGIIKKYEVEKGHGRIESEGKNYFFDKKDIKFQHDDCLEGISVTFMIGAQNMACCIQRHEAKEEYPDLILPNDTQDLLRHNENQVDNYALLQNYYFYKRTDKKGIKYEPLLYKHVNNCKKEEKNHSKISSKGSKLSNDAFEMNDSLGILKQLTKRNCYIAKNIWQEDYLVFDYKPDIALIIGTGNESASSNISVMVLHAIYGFPYIPASAIKGVVRGYFIKKEFKGNEADAIKDKKFNQIFGCGVDNEVTSANMGGLVFLDAYPNEVPKLYYEMFTPHYSNYYSSEGDLCPSDIQNTKLLSFPAIKNTSFQIIIGIHNNEVKSYVEELKLIIPEAIKVMGFGGKTSIGYGVGNANLIQL